MQNSCPNPECENGQIYDGRHCSECERAIGRACPTCQDGTINFDPRPSDPVELARQVAVELRKYREAWVADGVAVWVLRLHGDRSNPSVRQFAHLLHRADFGNLGPVAIADVIQRLEAKRAQEWAGDS